VRVIAPFIGGGFGPKIMMFYPEEVLVPWLAMRLGRPVKWIEDREENFFATTQERGRSTTPRSRSTRDGASWACATPSSTTPAPTTPTA
jgi:aerobic carbon-monoxide dehydrogenase large subunit